MIRRAVGIASPGWSTMGAVAGLLPIVRMAPVAVRAGRDAVTGIEAVSSTCVHQWISVERWMPSKRFDNLSIILPSQVRTVFERIESNHP